MFLKLIWVWVFSLRLNMSPSVPRKILLIHLLSAGFLSLHPLKIYIFLANILWVQRAAHFNAARVQAKSEPSSLFLYFLVLFSPSVPLERACLCLWAEIEICWTPAWHNFSLLLFGGFWLGESVVFLVFWVRLRFLLTMTTFINISGIGFELGAFLQARDRDWAVGAGKRSVLDKAMRFLESFLVISLKFPRDALYFL